MEIDKWIDKINCNENRRPKDRRPGRMTSARKNPWNQLVMQRELRKRKHKGTRKIRVLKNEENEKMEITEEFNKRRISEGKDLQRQNIRPKSKDIQETSTTEEEEPQNLNLRRKNQSTRESQKDSMTNKRYASMRPRSTKTSM